MPRAPTTATATEKTPPPRSPPFKPQRRPLRPILYTTLTLLHLLALYTLYTTSLSLLGPRTFLPAFPQQPAPAPKIALVLPAPSPASGSHLDYASRHNYAVHAVETAKRKEAAAAAAAAAAALLGVLEAEVAKPVRARAEWVVWVDAGRSVVLNPEVWVEGLLPPGDLRAGLGVVAGAAGGGGVGLLVSEGLSGGLDEGVVVLRVGEWGVRVLRAVVALGEGLERVGREGGWEGAGGSRSALEHVLKGYDESKNGWVCVPVRFFGGFALEDGRGVGALGVRPGDWLVRFVEGTGDRTSALEEWAEEVKANASRWEMEVEVSGLRGEIEGFWDSVRDRRKRARSEVSYTDAFLCWMRLR
ncbi:hypothetical protein MBLNU230_g8529t1 [Neophaeotheca triangularis]